MNMNIDVGKWFGTAVVLLVVAPACAQMAAPASSLMRPAQAASADSDIPATAVQRAGAVPKPVTDAGTTLRTKSGSPGPSTTITTNDGLTGSAVLRPGTREAINPQPLPPKPASNAKPGAASSINPQPLPPKPEPNWGVRKGDANSINPQPLPPKAAPGAALKSSATHLPVADMVARLE